MDGTVLYRKYRPRSFKDVQGQEHIIQVLIQSIREQSFSHGYLFSGPRGTGKTTTARLFAKAINFPEFAEYNDVVGEEDAILPGVPADNHADIIELDAASNRKIDDIRELKATIDFLPTELAYKVYIIDEAHMLTREAFNALLKTLEEPPEHVVFILATTEPHKLPVTIQSRLMRFDFRLAQKDELLDKLQYIASKENVSIAAEALELVYTLSGGSYRDAESLLQKVVSLGKGGVIEKSDVETLFKITSEQLLKDTVKALEEKDQKEIKRVFEIIKKESLSVTVFLEALLGFCIHQGKTRLLKVILEIYKSTFNVQDRYILSYASLLQLVENETGTTAKSNISVNSEENAEGDKSSKVSYDEQQSQKPNTSIGQEDKEVAVHSFDDTMIQKIDSSSERIDSILRQAKYKETAKEITVLVKFRFHLSQINNENMKAKISKIFDKNKKVVLAIKDDLTKDSQVSKEIPPSPKNVHKTTLSKQNKNQDTDVSKKEGEERSDQIQSIEVQAEEKPHDQKVSDFQGFINDSQLKDNSDLVESIL